MRQRFDARPSYAERCGERRRNFYRGFARHARFQRNAKSGLRGFDRIGGKRFAYRGFAEKHSRPRSAVYRRNVGFLCILGRGRQVVCGRIFFPVRAYRGGNGFRDGHVFLLSKRYIVALFLYPPCNGLFEGVQDERNFIGEAAAQIISQEKDLILFGYDYLDEDAGHRCEMQLEDMATSIRDRLPLKDRDHSVFPFRRR